MSDADFEPAPVPADAAADEHPRLKRPRYRPTQEIRALADEYAGVTGAALEGAALLALAAVRRDAGPSLPELLCAADSPALRLLGLTFGWQPGRSADGIPYLLIPAPAGKRTRLALQGWAPRLLLEELYRERFGLPPPRWAVSLLLHTWRQRAARGPQPKGRPPRLGPRRRRRAPRA